jgi:CheY-like chemotaxis protein/anti-sigma regulatory factor (Ser/Thr protein kinase)
VQNLLSFARRRKPEKSYFDINNLVQKTLDLRSYELKVNNINIHVNLNPDIPDIKADYHQIQQVLLNILINAEQALIEVRRRGKITVTTNIVHDRISINITDNGPGISDSYIDRIFDPFFTTKEEGKGTGLGLSVCHGIVTAHSGKISVESKKGKGTSFTIKLPLAVEEEVEIEEAPTVSGHISHRRKTTSENILIIDDEPGIRDVLTRIFSEKGFKTECASDAKTALSKLNRNSYDLYIIDLKIPKTTGKKLYETIVQKHPSSTGRVMFITGDTITPSTQDFLDSTGNPYLTKPFNPRVVLQLAEEILDDNITVRAS